MSRNSGGLYSTSPKPAHEINELIALLKHTKPNILGICEIGTLEDLTDLQQRLKQANISLPYIHLHKGHDSTRRLGFLSQYKLTFPPAAKTSFLIGSEQHHIKRGIMDIYAHTPVGKIRFIGLHLKSKRASTHYNQEYFRSCEAFTVKQHIIKILSHSTTQEDSIILFGDLNDTKNSISLKTIIGTSRHASYLKPLTLKDTYGLTWTYHWSHQDLYARYDYILCNKSALKLIDQKKSYIQQTTAHPLASDHRPLVLKFK